MNTIEYIKNLEAVGVSRAQAEVQALELTTNMEKLEAKIDALRKDIETNFATKQELREVRNELKADTQQLRTEIISEFKLVRGEMREMEGRLTIKLGGIMVSGIAFISILEHLYK